MSATENRGHFVWYELLTSNPQAGMDFYTKVVGWTTQSYGDMPEGVPPYNMWVGGQGPLGGVMQLPEEAKNMGAPPHWTSNVVVADVDATAAKVTKLGGKILQEPMTMPSVGRFAMIQDPQGAHLAIFTPSGEMPLHDSMKHGEFSWNELMTTDHTAAFKFYNAIFGWEKLQSHDMGPMGEYLIYGAHGKTLGGMFTKGKDMPMPAAWIYYIHVDDLDGAVARAKENGGQIVNGPMEVPGGDRIAQGMDPQGAFFALHEKAKGA